MKTWITGIALNECRNCFRSGWFQKERNTMPEKAPERVPELDFAEKLAKKETLTAQLKKLPAKYREPLILYYYQELKAKEIAEMLEISEAAVLQRLKRGREKLKWELKGEVPYDRYKESFE